MRFDHTGRRQISREDLNAVVGAVAALVAIVVALLALPSTKALSVIAIVSAIVFAVARWKRQSIPDPIWQVALVVGFASAAALAIVHFLDDGGAARRSAPAPAHQAAHGTVLYVYNKVTSGTHAMRESQEPVNLLTRPAAFCSGQKCLIPGTERETGETYETAVCQIRGERITNGEDESAADRRNPGRFESHRYYEVRLDDGVYGYVSEVWVTPRDRGGLGLPGCK